MRCHSVGPVCDVIDTGIFPTCFSVISITFCDFKMLIASLWEMFVKSIPFTSMMRSPGRRPTYSADELGSTSTK